MSDDILQIIGWSVVMAIAYIGEFAGFLILIIPIIIFLRFTIGKVRNKKNNKSSD
ncbi:hypothetical protein [Psychrobacter alimentarius]|uniref:hypothetical protein n=1 Tax=Psychrobacter alimentarius TaxID=261164 RepID=UPI0019180FC4|nr:hypothetical protein [Psychrobacter alimentarius]